VLGSLIGLRARERGFRVRLDHGIEATVVREPGGTWYSEDPIDHDEPSGKKGSMMPPKKNL
jgi:hypothetical protein